MKKSDEILEKIKKKEEQIEKRKKTTEKFEKKLEKCTDEWDRSFIQDDIKTSNGKLKELEGQLERLQEQLEKQLNKENVPKIPAIEALLDKWEEKMREFIEFCYIEYKNKKNLYNKSYALLEKEMGFQGPQVYRNLHYDLKYGRCEQKKAKEKYMSQEGRYKVTEENFERLLETYKIEELYENFKKEHFIFIEMYGNEEKIRRFMRDEKDARRIDLINRVTKVVGEIKDAAGLSFGYDDGINGVIIGTKGKAYVHTIDAGGWNIQKYHYRVLCTPMKEKESLKNRIVAAEGKVNGAGKINTKAHER